jgi:Ulp1 family protease
MNTRSRAKKVIREVTDQYEDNDDRFILKVKLRPDEMINTTTCSSKSESSSTTPSEIFTTFILRVPLTHEEKLKLLDLSLDDEKEMDIDDEYKVLCTYTLAQPYGTEYELNMNFNDYTTLKGCNYLNSNTIFFFLKILHENFTLKHTKCTILDTFFYSKLAFEENGDFDQPLINYKSIKIWAKVNLYNFDFGIYPVFKDKHWSLIILYGIQNMKNIFKSNKCLNNNQYPEVILLDSLPEGDDTVLKIFKKYMLWDYAIKYNKFKDEDTLIEFINENHRNIKCYIPDVPTQKNKHDCGIYLLTYAELLLDNPEKVVNLLKANKLKSWFNDDIIINKRKIIRKLVRDIKTYGKDKAIEIYRGSKEKLLNKYLLL